MRGIISFEMKTPESWDTHHFIALIIELIGFSREFFFFCWPFFSNQPNQKSERWQNHWDCPPLPLALFFFYNRHSSNISLGGCQATPPLNSPLTHKSNASDWCSHRSNRFHYHIKASCLQSLSESSRSQQELGWPCATYKILASSSFLWNYCYIVYLKKRGFFSKYWFILTKKPTASC